MTTGAGDSGALVGGIAGRMKFVLTKVVCGGVTEGGAGRLGGVTMGVAGALSFTDGSLERVLFGGVKLLAGGDAALRMMGRGRRAGGGRLGGGS